jgi:hypothetical protein
VYFPSYGWIPFDPTPNSATPLAAAVTPPTKPSPGHRAGHAWSSRDAHSSLLRAVLLTAVATVASVLFLGGAWLVLRRPLERVWLRRLWTKQPMRALYFSQSLFIRRLSRQFDSHGAITSRDAWPLAAKLGIAESEYWQWVEAAEGILYGAKPCEPQVVKFLQETIIKWMALLSNLS